MQGQEMGMKTYRVGIIGFGFIGKAHAYSHVNRHAYSHADRHANQHAYSHANRHAYSHPHHYPDADGHTHTRTNLRLLAKR